MIHYTVILRRSPFNGSEVIIRYVNYRACHNNLPLNMEYINHNILKISIQNIEHYYLNSIQLLIKAHSIHYDISVYYCLKHKLKASKKSSPIIRFGLRPPVVDIRPDSHGSQDATEAVRG